MTSYCVGLSPQGSARMPQNSVNDLPKKRRSYLGHGRCSTREIPRPVVGAPAVAVPFARRILVTSERVNRDRPGGAVADS